MRRLSIFVGLLLILQSNSIADEISIVTEDWSPYNYEENGKIVGLSTKIVRAVFKEAGVKVNITVYPWARAYKIALEKKNICIYTLFRSEERENKFKWVGPITTPANIFLYKLKKRSDIVINTLDDAKSYITGVMNQDYTYQYLVSRGFSSGKHLEIVSNELSNVRKLFKGRVDLFPAYELTLIERLKKTNLPFREVEIAFLLQKNDESKSYMGFSKKTPDHIINRIQAGFDRVRKKGIIESVYKEYIESLK